MAWCTEEKAFPVIPLTLMIFALILTDIASLPSVLQDSPISQELCGGQGSSLAAGQANIWVQSWTYNID